MVLSVTTCERKLSHVFTFVYNSLCQAITSRLTILTGWFIVCLAIASSSTGLLAVLASRGLSVGTRRWGVAGRRSLFLLGRSLLISSLLAVGALLCVASLLALVSSLLLLRIGVLLRLLGIRALLISRRLLAGRTVAAEGHKLQSVTNKIHCKTLWDYEEKSKPNTWRVQQKQPVVHIQDMQTGHYSWPAHYKRPGYCWSMKRQLWRNRSCCLHIPAQAECSPAVWPEWHYNYLQRVKKYIKFPEYTHHLEILTSIKYHKKG